MALIHGMNLVPFFADNGTYRVGLSQWASSAAATLGNLMELRVERIQIEAEDIISLDLVDPQGRPLPKFEAGAHIDLYLSSDIVRQYSLCNAPGTPDRYTIAVKKVDGSRGGSRAVHEIKTGELIKAGEPRNNFPLRESAYSLLIAGGIGITPLLSMASVLRARNAAFHLHYFTRSIEHAAFKSHLSTGPLSNDVSFHYDMLPSAMAGWFEDLLKERPRDAHIYLCGPSPFMSLVKNAAARTWPAEAIHMEYFSPEPLQGNEESSAFSVRLARKDRTLTVLPGKTILETLIEHGVVIDNECRSGFCGTCLTRVLSGIPDHRDSVLTEAERESGAVIAPCVSRAKGGLLELDI